MERRWRGSCARCCLVQQQHRRVVVIVVTVMPFDRLRAQHNTAQPPADADRALDHAEAVHRLLFEQALHQSVG